MPDKLVEFLAYLVEQIRGLPGAHPGLVDHRIPLEVQHFVDVPIA